ncbi:PTS system, arbutin-like IIC component [Spiroplasma litorale]|uniref:PTS system, arbutin-like IIC component n=1 Tax=Spiroplasma litorale TaxID=216942 RepID=A0A0K1W2D1_9MOLU|nr:PTS transporter subunit EIIC [Spiroplasma litorale]AKX34323.1 PTS system, arbutin-like IIC component [Spiroplasma litorale]
MKTLFKRKEKKEVLNDIPHPKNNFFSILLVKLQGLGKSLMYPIALLPFAALLNRFGSLAMELNAESEYNAGWWIGFIIAKPGSTIFDNLPLLFAIGTAFGLSKDQRGEAALVGAAFYLILVAMLNEGGLPKLFYDQTKTFDVWTKNEDGTWQEAGQKLSSLFYVPTYGLVNGKLSVIGGQYILNIGVLGGIVAGCLSAWSYNKFREIKLPQALSFFGGRRFVPMIIMVASVPVAFLFAAIWPWFQFGLISFGKLVSSGDSWAIPGAFLYGFINRMVQPTGLHHIINTFLWFQMPIDGYIVDFYGHVQLWNDMLSGGTTLLDSAGNITDQGKEIMQAISDSIFGGVNITNDNFKEFFNVRGGGLPNGVLMQQTGSLVTFTIFGDINAFQKSMVSGNFQTGYFPMFWGGLPGAAVAMIYCAKKDRRKETATFLAGVAFVAALTGIDEPLVFSFIFVGPVLWVINALFTSIFAAIAIAMHMHIGFGFSGGFIDYVISFANSWGMSKYEGMANGTTYGVMSNPLWMFVLAGLAFPAYFFTFTILIKKMNIKTPGRDDNESIGQTNLNNKEKTTKNDLKADKYEVLAEGIAKLVRLDNILKIENCSTRLRLTVKDNKTDIDDNAIKKLGVYGIKRLGNQGLQLIIGTDVEHVTNKLQKLYEIHIANLKNNTIT